MQHDTLNDEECAAILADVGIDTIRPGPRRFDDGEVGALVGKIIVASTARCPDDDAWLEVVVAPDVVSLRCPHCGASAEWHAR